MFQVNFKMLLVLIACLLAVSKSESEDTFKNPILDRNSADPAVLKIGDYYYLTLSENGETEITVFKSPVLTDFRDAEKVVAYAAKTGERNLWASEMHEVDGGLYIYFTMESVGKDHRMFAIKADDQSNPMGTWSDAIRLMPDWDNAAIDGTVLKHGNGKNYFVFASWAFGRPLSLYVAELYDPVTVGASKLYLRGPHAEWENQGGPTNEGPYFIYKNGVSFLVFSASSTWDPNYCLGLMSIDGDKDPMTPSHWWYGDDEPVFYRNDEESVFTTGHATFTVSNDGSETWMVYHGTVNTTHIDGYRIARIEKIDWDENGKPVFPRPHGYDNPQPVPSGQQTPEEPEDPETTFKNPILDRNSADPAIFKLGDSYYLTLSEEGETELTIYKSPILTDFRNAEKSVAYRTKNGQGNLWASEMHEVDGGLYIYFCMDGNGKDHRMYAIMADDPTNPMGTWSDATRLMPDWDHGAIDGTVMKHGNGKNYFVFSSTAFGRPLSLYVAELYDPVTVGASKLYLRGPHAEWEGHGGAVNEGPYFIYRNGVSFLVFSASSTWDPNYCLGLMSIDGDKDPMTPSHWWYGDDEPVFYRNDEEKVYTTGHAAFTVSNDETETWMVYHGTVNTTHINGFRIARIEKIEWDGNGRPVFPRPHGYDHPQLVPSGHPKPEEPEQPEETFKNPILDRNSADPSVTKVGDYYYLTLSEEKETELTIFKSPILTDFRNAEKVVAYRTKAGESNLWASEMHEVDGGLYIYFTMELESAGNDHRMFAIKANDPSNPLAGWSDAIRLMPDWDNAAIDGTVLKHGNGKNYFVFASWAFGRPLSLYVAELYDPVTVGASKLYLRGPHAEWEGHGGAVNEGPFFIYRNGVSFLVFSASSTWDPNYCLGLMSIDGDKDPMTPSHWWYGDDEPVFYRNDEESVYTTGHASFTVSNDGTETWMVYHGTVNTTHIDGYRIARIEKIDWDENGKPVFPRPHGYDNPQPVPSGHPKSEEPEPPINGTFTNPILDGNSADPAVLKVGEYYYLTLSENGETELTIYKSPILTDFRNAEKSVAYRTKPAQSNLWASEMHEVDGGLYIYFCMDGDGKDHRMYAIKADDSNDPMGTWSDAIRLMPDWDHGAIDGTVMKHGNGKNYFVFSSTAFERPLSLYVAELYDPVTVGASKLYLRGPHAEWEGHGGAVNEGPFFIYRNGVSFLVFSASSTWDPNYCLGLMSIDGDKDPMTPSHWWYGDDEPVFYRNDEESVFTTGHATFTVSNDGSETWMVYHGTVNTTHINGFRIARIERIDWTENGKPIFPRPHGYSHPQPVPSGQSDPDVDSEY